MKWVGAILLLLGPALLMEPDIGSSATWALGLVLALLGVVALWGTLPKVRTKPATKSRGKLPLSLSAEQEVRLEWLLNLTNEQMAGLTVMLRDYTPEKLARTSLLASDPVYPGLIRMVSAELARGGRAQPGQPDHLLRLMNREEGNQPTIALTPLDTDQL